MTQRLDGCADRLDRMGKARRIKSRRAAHLAETRESEVSPPTHLSDLAHRVHSVLGSGAGSVRLAGPEYPSLHTQNPLPAARDHLDRARKKHEGRSSPALLDAKLITALGVPGSFPRANTSLLDQWMSGWEIQDPYPQLKTTRGATRTSGAFYVAVVNDGSGPESTGGDPVYAKLPTAYLERCWRLSELHGSFIHLVALDLSAEKMHQGRRMVFEHADLDTATSPELQDLLDEIRDDVSVARETGAAARWAVAHEYAHRAATEAEKKNAWQEVLELWPDIEDEQWAPKKNDVTYAGRAMLAWRDEISCDILANWYVLRSPFAHDDALTQANGALLGLEAAVWDGWFIDQSRVSETHPSPTLRFRVSYRHWLSLLLVRAHGVSTQQPSMDSIVRMAHWRGFERWAAGAYGEHRDGAHWREDIIQVFEVLAHALSPEPLARVYRSVPEGGGFERTEQWNPVLAPLWMQPAAPDAMAALIDQTSNTATTAKSARMPTPPSVPGG